MVAHTVKNCLQRGKPRFDPWVGKIPLEKGITTHFSILDWKMSWKEPMGVTKGTTEQLTHIHACTHTHAHTFL